MEKQELYCHNCDRYVRFDVPETDGNLIVICPNCEHEHCRVVKDGIITGDRWDSRNGFGGGTIIYATGTSSSGTSFISNFVFTASSTGSTFVAQAWLDTTYTSS
jgi:hypothetical protein